MKSMAKADRKTSTSKPKKPATTDRELPGFDVTTESMSPAFRSGERIYIDPDLRARIGDFVVVRSGKPPGAIYRLGELVSIDSDTIRLRRLSRIIRLARHKVEQMHPVVWKRTRAA